MGTAGLCTVAENLVLRVPWPRSHSTWVVEPELEPDLSDFRAGAWTPCTTALLGPHDWQGAATPPDMKELLHLAFPKLIS